MAVVAEEAALVELIVATLGVALVAALAAAMGAVPVVVVINQVAARVEALVAGVLLLVLGVTSPGEIPITMDTARVRPNVARASVLASEYSPSLLSSLLFGTSCGAITTRGSMGHRIPRRQSKELVSKRKTSSFVDMT